jgi:hypothetical protein
VRKLANEAARVSLGLHCGRTAGAVEADACLGLQDDDPGMRGQGPRDRCAGDSAADDSDVSVKHLTCHSAQSYGVPKPQRGDNQRDLVIAS